MVLYTCERCGIFSSNIRSHYIRHLNRKKPCKPLKNNISIATLKSKIVYSESKMNPNESNILKNESKMNPNESKMNPNESNILKNESNILKFNQPNYYRSYQCRFCNKVYSTNSNLHKHMKKCKEKINDAQQGDLLNYISSQISELKEQQKVREEIHQKEKQQMRNEIEKLLEKVGNVTNHITNNQQNVYINTHGQEDLSYLTANYLTNLLKIPYGAVPQLLKDIHFHPEHPENMNIKITNKKLGFAKVWEGNKWNIKDKREVINNMLDKGFNIIDGVYTHAEKSLETNKKKKYEDFQKLFEDGDKDLHKKLEKNTEMLIINNS